MSYKYLSFFSGAMGLDIGLDNVGFECLSLNDMEKACIKTIEHNKDKKTKLYGESIRDVSAQRLRDDLGIKNGELFAVVGGPPCQAFSTAGKRLGLDDERGNVFLHFLDVSMELQPEFIVMENVRGLLSAELETIPPSELKTPYGKTLKTGKGRVLDLITKKLEHHGYTVNFNLYDMSYYGVPQRRERVIIFASRDGIKVPDILPTHKDSLITLGKEKVKTVRDALEGIESTEWINFSKKNEKYYKLLKNGENWRSLPEELRREAIGDRNFFRKAGGGKTGLFRRQNWDKPSTTLLTSPRMFSSPLVHPDENRYLSVEEYAALQTFPKGYHFEGTLAQRYKQIGNAVPCKFGEAIGKHLIEISKGNIQDNYNLRLSRYLNTSYDTWREKYEKEWEKDN